MQEIGAHGFSAIMIDLGKFGLLSTGIKATIQTMNTRKMKIALILMI